MSNYDCLIWIGGPYQTVDQFVKEAEQRGCCRKVPSWPSWVKPNKTRVFLAHRDGHDRTDRGSLFGYFIPHGVDIILTQEKCEQYKNLLSKYRAAREEPKDLKPLLDFWHGEFHGKRLPISLPENPGGRPGEPPIKRSTRKPHGPLNDDSDDEAETPSSSDNDFFIEFLLDFVISCEPNGDGSGAAGYGISNDQTALEADRDCGSRPGTLGAPAFYLVDALAREIESIFCEILKKLIKEELEQRQKGKSGKKKTAQKEVVQELKRNAQGNTQKGLWQGIPEFEQAVRRAFSKRKKWATIPDELSRIASTRGALVVFKKPYPSFRRLPQAAFRGLLRIDGDQLLKEIQAARASRSQTREIILPYYRAGLDDGRNKKSESQLITQLAQEWQASKSFVENIWESFLGMITDELQKTGRITLTNVGTLSVKGKAGTKQVKFKPSDVLKRKV